MTDTASYKLNGDLMSARWSLITVTYNSAAKLRQYWSELNLPDAVEWVVVDNASSDDSVAVAQELGARVIPLPRNVGFGAANNIGFDVTEGAYVAFVNPDVTPVLDDLSRLAQHLSNNPNDLVAPQLVNDDLSLQPNGRGRPYLSAKIVNRLRDRGGRDGYLLVAQAGEVLETDWLMGAMVAGTRDRIKKIGVWDERFFVYYEDSDLGLRNAAHGGRSVVLGDIRWIHGWARETKAPSLAAWRLELPSMVKFYSRYPNLILGSSPHRRRVEAK
ncbi:glycosyltransferase family 2 protein [Microbacterium laevaniformans]|uniref:Glycosyltransferase family 2 protein n=2 Tax=Microbacterium laevaniformans TaxID=36807 RepID=A0A4S2DEV9_9MICO|nr:glycosyltransferase family 2 protein [Microbacterium laevaniformans]